MIYHREHREEMTNPSKRLLGSAATRLRDAIAGLMGKGSTAESFRKGEDAAAEGATMHSALHQSTWVYSCINTIASSVAQVPFRVSRGERKGEDILDDGKLVELLKQPHPQLNQFQFRQLWVTWLMLRGEAFVVPHYAGNGRARRRRMLVLCPDHFQHVVEDNELMGWRYTGYGPDAPYASHVFLPEEIRHSRFPNPYHFWRGAGPNNVALLAASTDYASAQFMKGLMLNNADTGIIAETEQAPSPEQREQILAALRERKRKAGTADRPLLLWGGFKMKRPEVSSADLQFLENRKFNRQEICAIFGVPQELLGFTEDANRSVSDAARLNFIENRISPLCEMLESDMEPLIAEYEAEGEKLFGWFDVDSLPVMQKARHARIDSAVKLFGMGVPIHVANEVLDLGLPAMTHGDKSFLPFNLAEVGETTDKTDKPKKPKNPEAEPNAAEKLLRVLDAGRSSGQGPAHTCGAQSEAYAASIAGSVRNKTAKLRRFFFEQRGRVLSKLDKLTKEFGSEAERTQKGIDDVFDASAEDAELLGKMKPLLVADLQFGGAQLWREIGLQDFLLPPGEAIEFLRLRENRLKGINEETFEQLRESLQDGLAQGETFQQLSERVKVIFNDASDVRAETIALTETNTAVNGGRFTGMKLAKVEKKGWQASNLENVRATHLQAEQTYAKGIPIEKPFLVGGVSLMYPGDPNGSAAEVINCRCFTFAVIAEKACVPTQFLRWEDFAQK